VPDELKTFDLCFEAVGQMYWMANSIYNCYLKARNEGRGVYVPMEPKLEGMLEYVPKNLKSQVKVALEKIIEYYD